MITLEKDIISNEIKDLFYSMLRVNIFFHFTRNRKKHTELFYQRFIAIIGAENYDRLLPLVRNSWEGARYDFDRMYGLTKAWKEFFPALITEKASSPSDFSSQYYLLCREIESIIDGKLINACSDDVKMVYESLFAASCALIDSDGDGSKMIAAKLNLLADALVYERKIKNDLFAKSCEKASDGSL